MGGVVLKTVCLTYLYLPIAHTIIGVQYCLFYIQGKESARIGTRCLVLSDSSQRVPYCDEIWETYESC